MQNTKSYGNDTQEMNISSFNSKAIDFDEILETRHDSAHLERDLNLPTLLDDCSGKLNVILLKKYSSCGYLFYNLFYILLQFIF